MIDQPKNAELTWDERGVPIATQFDDPYFSFADGLAETRHVFLGGNGLPARFTQDFVIAELGFGTGLNLLAAWQAWNEAGFKTPLCFVSFEAFPMQPDDMRSALSQWPELEPLANQLIEAIETDGYRFSLPCLEAEIIIRDARSTLPQWSGKADAWFLDGFSPAKNPELWEEDILVAVADHTKVGGTAATYSAAGHVRTKLANAGFEVDRIPGFGRKRHMVKAVKR